MKKPTRRATLASFVALPLTLSTRIAGSTPFRSEGGDSETELLRVRESVWRAWFGGRKDELLAVLPENFVGIGAGGGPGRGRDETVEDAAAFAANGGRLTDLQFPENRVQRLGDVAVIYCTFSFTVTGKDGTPSTVSGRATEVFQWTGSRWLHPGWHLDSGR